MSRRTTKKSISSVAESFVDELAAGKFNTAATHFDATMRSALPTTALGATWHALSARYGAYKRRQPCRIEHLGPHTIVFVPSEFNRATVDLKIVFTGGSGKISGFFVAPHRSGYHEAPYVVKKSFTESPVTVGEGRWKLDGTLAMPAGDGPFPAVVLVHGSGPNDRDETIGPNRPFRDIAHGLASKGIAVVRYEKRTKQYGPAMASIKNLTVKDESIEDAVAAVNLLRSNRKIDKNRIYVLGHSLGGMLVPRIAGADADIAGFISMAGSNEPLEDAMLRQSRYIMRVSGASNDAGQKKKLAELERDVARVKSLKADDQGAAIMGVPCSYWLDLRKHDPLEEIKNVRRPVLFLQGGRDYQVTAKGDFQRWQQAVKSVPEESKLFQFKLYPSLNHLFMAGKGQCTPGEYLDRVGNVDGKVIDDIAAWVKAAPSA